MSRTKFDAPRPAVTNRLGKKRTDELIRADGDTWQEYLAVSEKPRNATNSIVSSRGGAFSFFGKKNKKKESSNIKPTGTNNYTHDNSCSNNLVIRSYFQNRRTGKKVWDEPPSGASKIIPASEEMRRMAELQLGELYVTTVSNNTNPNDTSTDSTNSGMGTKKKALGSGIFRRGNNSSDRKNTGSGSSNSRRRIRYKPDSNLFPTQGARRNPGDTLGDRELREVIERSIAETTGPTSISTKISEDEVLRRVLEESRLEALASSNSLQSDHFYNDIQRDKDRKLAACKNPPANIENDLRYQQY